MGFNATRIIPTSQRFFTSSIANIKNSGDKMELISRPYPKWSLSRIQNILYRDMTNIDALEELSQMSELGHQIRNIFQKRLLNGPEDMTRRLQGVAAPDSTWRHYRLVRKDFISC